MGFPITGYNRLFLIRCPPLVSPSCKSVAWSSRVGLVRWDVHLFPVRPRLDYDLFPRVFLEKMGRRSLADLVLVMLALEMEPVTGGHELVRMLPGIPLIPEHPRCPEIERISFINWGYSGRCCFHFRDILNRKRGPSPQRRTNTPVAWAGKRPDVAIFIIIHIVIIQPSDKQAWRAT